MATEAELQQAILDVEGRRVSWVAGFDQLRADADAYSIQQRGRPLPAPNALGQLPDTGVQITEHVGGQEAGGETTTIILGEDVPWQNLANKIQDTAAQGLGYLDTYRSGLMDALAAERAAEAAAQPQEPATAPTGDPHSILPWVDFIAGIIAYGLVFWGLMTAVQGFNPFNLFVGLGMAALTVTLGTVIVRPLQAAVRVIFGAIVQILADLVEFVGAWLAAVARYFQGDFLKAVLRIVLLAAFMWIWELAQQVPAIKNVLDYAAEAVGNAVRFVNQVFDQTTHALELLRKDTEDGLSRIFGQLGEAGTALRQDLLAIVDGLFAGMERRLSALRFEILGEVDLVSAALRAHITVFGITLQRLPEEIRLYLLAYTRARPLAALQDSLSALVGGGFGTGTIDVAASTPWVIQDELEADLRAVLAGGRHEAADELEAVRADILALHAGTPSEVEPFEITPPPADEEHVPTLA